MALPLNGKKNRLHKDDFLIYFAKERLGLTQKSIDQTIHKIVSTYPKWLELINKSFLSAKMKNDYASLLQSRFHLLGI